MSSDDIDLGQQTGLASQLSKSLAEANTRMNSFSATSRTQAKFAIDIANSFEKTSENLNSMANSTEKINNCLGSFLQNVKNLSSNSGMSEFFKSFAKHVDDSTERFKKSAAATEELSEVADKAKTSSEKSQESLNKVAEEEKKYATSQKEQTKDYIANLTKANKSAEDHNKTQEEFAQAAEEAEKAGKSWAQRFKSTISFGISLIKIIGSLISTATTWVKTVFTLPFMVLKNVVKAGNALRSDLVTVIEQAAQETKEFFDSFSDIGQGIRRMTSMGKGMLLEFELVNSDAVKLFGDGASGIATMIKETASSIKAMGHYSEMFGSTITKNKASLFHFTRIKKAMGLEDDQIAYYAQDAALNLMGVNKRITTMALLTDDVSKQYGVDMKRLGKNFNILRKDIALYGHLSDEELLKTSARLTQMKITVEDASSVFKKFNTFEDAANSVAMLSQTFGMNLDAMEIIQAKNPEDIINMFRNSMIATGRTFDEFNRFEKEILADQTGMSQEGLKALMTLRDKGLTHQEAVDAMKDQTPEAKQLKAIKELSSSINMLQKVMNFTSPFEAFMKGLGKNAAASGEARKAFMSLSNTYQMIHDFAIKLDGDTISALLEPVILIVDVMKNILNSPGFKGGLTSLVKGFSNMAMNLFGVTETDKVYTVLEKNLTGMTKEQKVGFASDVGQIEKDIDRMSVKNLWTEFKNKPAKKFKSRSERFSEFLKAFKTKSLTDPQVKKEFDQLIKNFHTKYKMSSFETNVKTRDGTVETLNKFATTIKNTIGGNEANFEKFFDITGKTAGAIIKGAAILLISGVNLLNHVVDKVDPTGLTTGHSGQNLIESFFDWDPGTIVDLGEELLGALSGLFAKTGKLAFFGVWISEQFFGLLLNVGTFFWSALKEAGRLILPNVFDKEDTLTEVMTKVERGAKGVYKEKGQRSSAKGFDISSLEGKKSYASRVKDVSGAAQSAGANQGLQETVAELRGRGLAGTADSSDYNRAAMIEGNLAAANQMGPPAPPGTKGVSSSTSGIFGSDAASTKLRNDKLKLFDKTLKQYWGGTAWDSNPIYKEIADKGWPAPSGSYGNDMGKFKDFAHDKTNLIKHMNKSNSYYNVFGKWADRIDKSWGSIFSDKNIEQEFKLDIMGDDFKYPKNKADYDSLRDNFNSRPQIFLDQLSGWKSHKQLGIDKKKFESNQQMNSTGHGKKSQYAGGMRDGILDTMTSFASSFAAKPGGVVDTLFSGLSRLSTEAAATSANIGNMYGDSSISSSGDRLTNKKVDNMCKKLEEYKAQAKDPKCINVPFDISDEICDLLGTRLVERGLLDKMSRPDIMSASTTRLLPGASTAGNLQTGRHGINPGQEYLYYENA
jgi:chemotaxis protein histidine kinase CheA